MDVLRKNLAVPLNLVWMLGVYLLANVLNEWLGAVLFTQFRFVSGWLTSLPILALALLGFYLFSRWRERNMRLGTVQQTIESIKVDGALLSIALALALWCSGSTGRLTFDQVFSLLAIVTPYLAGQVRAERIQQNVVGLVQASQAALEKLRQSGLKQISMSALLGLMEDQAANSALMKEIAERKLNAFSQELRQQGYQVEMRLNKLTREPVLFFEKIIQQGRKPGG